MKQSDESEYDMNGCDSTVSCHVVSKQNGAAPSERREACGCGFAANDLCNKYKASSRENKQNSSTKNQYSAVIYVRIMFSRRIQKLYDNEVQKHCLEDLQSG